MALIPTTTKIQILHSMKPTKIILNVSLLLLTAVVALAAPPAKRTFPALRSAESLSEVKAGDHLALVCKMCDTVTVLDVTSREDAMKLCTEGEMIACGSCKETFKVVAHGPRSKSGRHIETRIVNESGEECMFVTKLPD